ncbi:MAG: hypothetical protein NZO16_06055 [Deltaproteobacteria bacterium]|nr:hypothetical protein [Deltaproteobacteria bacterium]
MALVGQNKNQSSQGAEKERSESSRESTDASNTLDGLANRLAGHFINQKRKFEECIKKILKSILSRSSR